MLDIIDKRLLNPDGSVRDGLGGFETEYGVSAKVKNSALTRRGANDPGADVTAEFVRLGFPAATLPNIYGEDGDREYIDIGSHPEISCAEDVDIALMAFRVARGHVKVAERYRRVLENNLVSQRFDKPLVVKIYANTCGMEHGNSWGSHQNYLAMRALEPGDYAPALVAHHAARIVWSGVGLVLEGKRKGSYSLALSEKAEYIETDISEATTTTRPLLNTRDEPLASKLKYRRIHDVSGETAMNPLVNALRMASGRIILRSCEEGTDFSDLVPEQPAIAMKEISRDTTLTKEVKIADGRYLSGIEIEQEILTRAMRATLTSQEEEYGKKLLELLEDLKRDPLSCVRRVDWVLKKALIEKELSAKTKRKQGETDFILAWAKALDYHSILPEGAGMRMLRKGKYELSPSEEMLENGVPLPHTRAMLRGDAIRRLNKTRREFSAEWYAVKLNDQANKTVIINEPYETENERLEALLQGAAA